MHDLHKNDVNDITPRKHSCSKGCIYQKFTKNLHSRLHKYLYSWSFWETWAQTSKPPKALTCTPPSPSPSYHNTTGLQCSRRYGKTLPTRTTKAIHGPKQLAPYASNARQIRNTPASETDRTLTAFPTSNFLPPTMY